MSDISKDDRPKLKAKRFNKFKPSSHSKITVEDRKDFTKQGVKRSMDSRNDEYHPSKQKKNCESTSNLPTSTTKNLANNRLKRLKDQIQADLISRNKGNLSDDGLPSTKSIGKTNKNNSSSRSLVKSNKIDYTIQKKYEQILSEHEVDKPLNHSFNSPNLLCKKNLANERLQNIKKKLIDTDHNPDSSSTSNKIKDKINTSVPESSHCPIVKINENKIVGGLKRNINITNTYDFDAFESSSKRLAVEPSALSRPVTMINNDCSDIQVTFDKSHLSCMQEKSSPGININNNKVVSKRNTDITDMPCTPVSQRLLNIKNNNSTGNTQITNCSTPQYNSGSQQPLNMKTNKPYENNNDNLISRIDPQITQRLSNSQQNISDTSLMKNCSDNFFTKMAMTASWIRNHQDLGNTDNQSVDKSENSRNVTTDQSSNKANFDYETKDMEWTNAEPDDEIMDTKMIVKENIEEKTSVKKDPEKLRDVCIIVDTNVFISGLSKIQDIVNLKLTGIFKPLIYIPWMVITELDYMKDSCSDAKLKKNILNSIKFINTALKENNPRVTGQTVFDMDKQKQVGPSPDDKIISCCLQVAEKYETVILLSNDINLKNKAMLNNLTACSTNEVMVKIMSKLAKNNKTQKIMNKMGIMCSSVICECAKETYGDVWMKMDMLSYPPWSLVECLKRFKKYWGSVFKEKLMKQFTKVIEELLNLLQINKYICDDSEEFIEFMRLCITLCIFLKDIEECRGFVENSLNGITKLG